MELLVKVWLVTDKQIQQFRDAVYQSLRKRPDAVLDLIDALTVAGHVESPVALSEQAPFSAQVQHGLRYSEQCGHRL